MGAALGGGAAESAFGSDTTNILTKGTIYGIIAFFLVALGLFLMYQAKASDRAQFVSAGELISADEEPSAGLVPEVEAEEAGVDAVAAIAEDVTEVVENLEGTADAVVESIEVEAPALDVGTLNVEAVPASN